MAENRITSRKFWLTVSALIVTTALLVSAYIDADTWGWVFTTALGLYFGANVTQRYAEKPSVRGGIFSREYDDFAPPVDYSRGGR